MALPNISEDKIQEIAAYFDRGYKGLAENEGTRIARARFDAEAKLLWDSGVGDSYAETGETKADFIRDLKKVCFAYNRRH